MSEEDLAAVGMLKLGLVREEEEEEDILPLRPILRMDQVSFFVFSFFLFFWPYV